MARAGSLNEAVLQHPNRDERPESSVVDRQSGQFLVLYALAVAGGAIAYMPLLTILLPSHVSSFAGQDSLTLLAYIAFGGAISASISNILFGWISDLTKKRRFWIALGFVLSSGLLLTIVNVRDPALIIGLIIVWQLCLNMMLAPLAAWAADCVPDSQKGLLGGLLAFAPALGAFSGALVTHAGWVPVGQRIYWVAGMVALCVLPVLVLGKPRHFPQSEAHGAPDAPTHGTAHPAMALASRMWLARLLVQIAEASLFAFLLLWFRSLDPTLSEGRVAGTFTMVLGGAVIFALFLGRWSDVNQRPISPLIFSAICAAAGLAIMAIASGLTTAIVGYVIFGLASSIFLALHGSQTLRVLPNPARRGRDLGIFNLTNTVPSLIMPWLTLALVPLYGFSALFVVLALLALAAALLLARWPGRDI